MNDELGPDARALIRGAVLQESSIGAPRRARLKRSLLAKAMVMVPGAAQAAGISGSGGALSSALSAGKLALLAAKGAGAGLLVAVAVHGVGHFVPRSPAPSRAASADHGVKGAFEPPGRERAAENGEYGGAAEPSPSVSAGAVPAAVLSGAPSVLPASSGAEGPSLSGELLLMAEVQRALRDGRAGRALELVDQHAASFPRGQLVNERLAAEAFAACQSGDVARARRAAARFLQRDATSSLAVRVKKTCAPEAR